MTNPIRYIAGVGEGALSTTTTTTVTTTTSSSFSTTSSTSPGDTTYSTTTSSSSTTTTSTSTTTTSSSSSSTSTTTTTSPPLSGTVVTEQFDGGVGNLSIIKGSSHFTLSSDNNRQADEPYSIPGNKGPNAAKFFPTDNSSSICFAKMVDPPVGHDDIDVVVRAYSNYYDSEDTPAVYILVRYEEQEAGRVSAYGVQLDNWEGRLSVGKFVDGVWTDFISMQDCDDEWMYYRIQVIGSSVKFKWWSDNGVEPYEWLYETTDTDITGTVTAPVVIGTSITDIYEEGEACEFGAWFDYISVGTGGEEPVVPDTPQQYYFGCSSFYNYEEEYINYTAIIGGQMVPSGRKFRGIEIYWDKPVVNSSVRAAVYEGGTVDDPSGATLLHDFGQLTPLDDHHQDRFTMTLGQQVEITSDIIWVAIKSDGNNTKINYNLWSYIGDESNNKLWRVGQWTQDTGYFDITSEVTNNDATAFPATIPSATYSSSGKYIGVSVLLDGNPYSPTTTTTTTTITTTSSSTASTSTATTSSSSTASSTSTLSSTSTVSTTTSTSTVTTTCSSTVSSTSTQSSTSSSSSTMSSTSSFSTTTSSTTTTEPWEGKSLNVIIIGV